MDLPVLEKKAIKAALSGNWEEALSLNEEIVKEIPNDIGALNRLALAFWETGKLKKAKEKYKTVLELDRYNPIASKNLERIVDQEKRKVTKKTLKPNGGKIPPLAQIFLEEPGKTKVLNLLRVASPKILVELSCADRVFLSPKKRVIDVNREDGIYLGCLPEDVSQRLISLIEGGNHYDAYVKGVKRHSLEIFIKETFRSRRFKNLPSFSNLTRSFLANFAEEN